MSNSSPIAIQPLTTEHFNEALNLCRLSGWNQLRVDWQRLLAYEPDGCFVAVSADTIVGTVTTTRYGNELAWIGMMLVHPDFRRQGIATALMRRSIEYLRQTKTSCIKLDATPVGQHVYQNLGFEVEWGFQRWQREGQASATASACEDARHTWPEDSPVQVLRIQPDVPQTADWQMPEQSCLTREMLALDRKAFGADRGGFIQVLAKDSFVCTLAGGYGMSRYGYLASYLGPIVAESLDVAHGIVQHHCSRHAGAVFWDIPSRNEPAIQLAQSMGFAPVRELTRMRLGSERRSPCIEYQYGIGCPSTG